MRKKYTITYCITAMKLSQFKYSLPHELIALHPLEDRDEARMMVLNRKTQTIEHKLFKEILDYFDEGDLFVLNNTKVFPALLFGEKEKTGANIKVTLLRELEAESRLWDVLVDPARKIRIGNKLYFGEDNDRRLQSPSAVILEPKKIKSVTVSIVSPSVCHEVRGPDAMIFVC